MPALDIPLAQAEQLLTQRIESGRELLHRIQAFSGGPTFAPGSSPPTFAMESPGELWRHVKLWHDFNRTWVDVNLGMPITKEYENLGGYNDLHGDLYNADQAVRTASDGVRQELLLLESIRDRLPIWAPEPQAGPDSGHDTRTSHNAPIFIVHVLQLPFHGECSPALFSVTGVLQLAVT